MLIHSTQIIDLVTAISDKTSELHQLQNGNTALHSIDEISTESLTPVLQAMGVYDYSPESKGGLLEIFAKGLMVAGTLLVSYYKHLEDQLTEMDATVTGQLDEMEDYLWVFKDHDVKDSKSLITQAPLQTMLYLNNRPVTQLDRLIHESEQIVELATVLTTTLYERIIDIDKTSSHTADTLSLMRIMKTVDTSRNYLGGRRLETNFNSKDTLKIAWTSSYFQPRSVGYTVTLDDFGKMIKTTRLIIRTIRMTKETLKLSKQATDYKNQKAVRENITTSLYVPLLLDMVKLKDIYMQLMFDFVRQNKQYLKK